MAHVENLHLVLERRPQPHTPLGVALRHYGGPADIEPWLELRHRAFAREKVGVGRWDLADFEREFLMKPWWSPERMWLAEIEAPSGSVLVGSVTWADRGRPPGVKAAVHWLSVLPGFRRRGIGRLLLEALHLAVWDEGGRDVFLETHTAWTAAGRLYAALGYRPV